MNKMDNENKRYQVFISSTFNDLKQERAEVTQALLELDCIPCGMEAFPAANETQWSWIKRVIEECDYYVLVIGGMYGTVSEETGLSYTEMEYDYAVKKKVPTIAFIIEDEGKLLGDKLDSDPDKKKKLKAFKDRVKKNLCKFYTSPEDLGGKVSRSITQLKKTNPRIGWVRADSVKNYSPNEDVIRLMKKNDELVNHIKEIQTQVTSYSIPQNNIAQDDEVFEVKYSWTYCDDEGEPITDKKCSYVITWREIYKNIGVKMINKTPNFEEGQDPISEYIFENEADSYCKKKKLTNDINLELEGSVDYTCLVTILMQFNTLGYLEKKGKNWVMTEKGLDYFSSIVVVESKKNKK